MFTGAFSHAIIDGMVDDGSVLAVMQAAGLRSERDYDMLADMMGCDFIMGADILMFDHDIGVFRKRRGHVLREHAFRLCTARRDFIDSPSGFDSRAVDRFMWAHDFIDVADAVSDEASRREPDGLGVAVRFLEILSAALYRANMMGQDMAGLLTSIPVFDSELIELAAYPEEYAVEAMLASL